jgi:hypothetical protein
MDDFLERKYIKLVVEDVFCRPLIVSNDLHSTSIFPAQPGYPLDRSSVTSVLQA